MIIACFIIWAIGAILAFALVWAEYCARKIISQINDYPCKDQTGMIVIGTILSWVTIFYILYQMHKQIKEEEKQFKDKV